MKLMLYVFSVTSLIAAVEAYAAPITINLNLGDPAVTTALNTVKADPATTAHYGAIRTATIAVQAPNKPLMPVMLIHIGSAMRTQIMSQLQPQLMNPANPDGFADGRLAPFP